MLAIFTALDGVGASLIPPSTVIPLAISAARRPRCKARGVFYHILRSGAGRARPDRPETCIAHRRTADRKPRSSASGTVLTLLTSGIADVAGSRRTRSVRSYPHEILVERKGRDACGVTGLQVPCEPPFGN